MVWNFIAPSGEVDEVDVCCHGCSYPERGPSGVIRTNGYWWGVLCQDKQTTKGSAVEVVQRRNLKMLSVRMASRVREEQSLVLRVAMLMERILKVLKNRVSALEGGYLHILHEFEAAEVCPDGGVVEVEVLVAVGDVTL
jgi:hypothetical protein